MYPTKALTGEILLVVVDIQERLADVMPRRAETVAASAFLVRAAGVLGVPLVVTRQYPKGLGPVVREVVAALDEAASAGPTVHHSDKTSFDCCEETGFTALLDDSGRTQVALAGMESHICIAQTALALAATGRQVFVAADARGYEGR